MDNLNVLIVEDESLIALELTQLLEGFGCNLVKYATHPKKALKLMEDETFNLILMDINLKFDITGIELYKSFKTNLPVIYITAYNDEKTIEEAISTNPLGYLIKPYKQEELQALLLLAKYKFSTLTQSRSIFNDNEKLSLGEGFHFDEKKEMLYSDSVHINLGNKELKLLKLLIYNRGFVVDFKTIENELWEECVVSSSTLRTLIYRLRGKLEYKVIETVYNQGLKINF